MGALAAPLIMGGSMMGAAALGGGNGGGSSGGPTDPRSELQKKTLDELLGIAKGPAAERLRRAGGAYPGQLTAPLSGLETSGLDLAEQFMGSPFLTESPLFQQGMGGISDILSEAGKSPYKTEFYQAFRSNLMRELEEAKDRLASKTSAGDKFFGGGRIAAEGEMEETAMGQLQERGADMFRFQQQLAAGTLPLAFQAAGLPSAEMAERAQLGLGFGGYERGVEQAGLDAQYQEYLRQLGDLGIPLEVATGIAAYSPQMVNATGPNFLQQLAPFASALGGGGGLSGLLGGLTQPNTGVSNAAAQQYSNPYLMAGF